MNADKCRCMSLAAAGCGLLTGSAHAGFVGWAAATRTSGSTILVDVVANFDSASDRVLNVFDATIVASGTAFLQDAALPRKAWAPQAGQTGEDRDSFMTLGAQSPEPFGLAGSTTAGDPNFTATPGAWNGTPLSAAMTTVPPEAGWYSSDPGSPEIVAVDLDSLLGAAWQGRSARYGVWVAHFAFDAATLAAGSIVSFQATVGYKPNASPGGATFGTAAGTFVVPAPGAAALLGAAITIAYGGRRR